ncbi:MAG: alpha-glucuronidase family glycosyl hydrolase, partial [bacterium]|nr:alpha-glucuronidase family glycosyl hydrolase [bacterium]
MLTIARSGRALTPIIVQRGATEPERYAADELAKCLQQITGAVFDVREADTLPPRAIVVGQGALADRLQADIDRRTLGGEETLLLCRDGYLLLSGGRPRGTLYAVYRFLQRQLGVRWWTPWATQTPR